MLFRKVIIAVCRSCHLSVSYSFLGDFFRQVNSFKCNTSSAILFLGKRGLHFGVANADIVNAADADGNIEGRTAEIDSALFAVEKLRKLCLIGCSVQGVLQQFGVIRVLLDNAAFALEDLLLFVTQIARGNVVNAEDAAELSLDFGADGVIQLTHLVRLFLVEAVS